MAHITTVALVVRMDDRAENPSGVIETLTRVATGLALDGTCTSIDIHACDEVEEDA